MHNEHRSLCPLRTVIEFRQRPLYVGIPTKVTKRKMSSRLQSVAPVIRLNSRTMGPTISLFSDMGFMPDVLLGDPPRFAMMHRDELTVMLECKFTIPWKYSGWAVYFWVSELSLLRAEFIKSGINQISDIVKKDYGCLEFKVRMPDKRSLVFGERTVS